MGTAGGTSGRGEGNGAWPFALVPQAAAHLFAKAAQLKESQPGTEV